jgi:hypothetical protein
MQAAREATFYAIGAKPVARGCSLGSLAANHVGADAFVRSAMRSERVVQPAPTNASGST